MSTSQPHPPTTYSVEMNPDSEIVTCTIQNFIASYMPFVPSEEVMHMCINDLTEGGHLIQNSDGKGFFLEALDEESSVEGGFFKPLERICAILKESLASEHPTPFRFALCPNQPIKPHTGGLDNTIDACLTEHCTDESDPSGLCAWDIATVFELRCLGGASDVEDNTVRAINANAQIINQDVRRMFAFGVTIECEGVRMWYHCRSHSAVTKPFNLNEDPILFIKVLVSFLSAPREQLGYDPMVHRQHNGHYIYKIPVPTHHVHEATFYHTLAPLKDHKFNGIAGRAARVWEVEPVSSFEDATPTGCPCVLKDLWLNCNSPTERELQEQIIHDLGIFLASSNPEDKLIQRELEAHFSGFDTAVKDNGCSLKQFFLHIAEDAEGGSTTPVVEPYSRPSALQFPKPLSNRSPQEGHHSSTPISSLATGPHTSDKFIQKRQYRVVFSEMCTSVDGLQTLGKLVDVLNNSLLGFAMMYCAGWVHQDISSANIMAFRSNVNQEWQAKICDLEYAKKFGSTKSSFDEKKGTPYFMAVDILQGDWGIDKGQAAQFTNAATHPGTSYSQLSEQLSNRLQQETPKQVPFFATFRHDLESLWWTVVFSATARVQHEPSKGFVHRAFQNSVELSTFREQCITKPIAPILQEVLHPCLACFVQPLEAIRIAFEVVDVNCIMHDSVNQQALYSGLYCVFRTELDRILRATSDDWRNLELLPLGNHRQQARVTDQPGYPPPPRRNLKRKRSSASFIPSNDGSDSDADADIPSRKSRKK